MAKKGTPYIVRVMAKVDDGPFDQAYTVHVPDDFDRVRGADDTARDLAAKLFADSDAAYWRAGHSRRHGEVRFETATFHSDVTMDVQPKQASPSGCPIHAGEKVSKRTTYRVIKVGDRKWNDWMGTTKLASRPKSVREALMELAGWGWAEDGCHWRIVEIPAGEPWDYDGTIVASLKTGRGVE